MIMCVDFHFNIKYGAELIDIGFTARAAQYALLGEWVKFGYIAAKNGIARR